MRRVTNHAWHNSLVDGGVPRVHVEESVLQSYRIRKRPCPTRYCRTNSRFGTISGCFWSEYQDLTGSLCKRWRRVCVG